MSRHSRFQEFHRERMFLVERWGHAGFGHRQAVWLGLAILGLVGLATAARAGDDSWDALILSAAQVHSPTLAGRLKLQSLRLPARLPPRPDPMRTRVEFRRHEDFSGPTVVGLIVDGRRSWARVSFQRFTEVVVALRDLPAGAVLADTDLALRSLPAPAQMVETCRAPAEAVGRILRVAVKEGAPIQADRLERPLAVEVGERVTVEASAGAVLLRVSGQALAAGRVGDRIPVLNLQSGRRIEARILGTGRVSVETALWGGMP